jgi:hypothetical protein
MVQVATTLPMFLFALPAGALADIVDRRKFLIVAEVLYTTVAAIFAAIVWSGAATPGNLLLFTFLMGVGRADGSRLAVHRLCATWHRSQSLAAPRAWRMAGHSTVARWPPASAPRLEPNIHHHPWYRKPDMIGARSSGHVSPTGRPWPRMCPPHSPTRPGPSNSRGRACEQALQYTGLSLEKEPRIVAANYRGSVRVTPAVLA